MSIVHGGFIQLSGLYALASEWTAMEPSALHMISRKAGASRAPRRPSYVTEHRARSSRTVRVWHAARLSLRWCPYPGEVETAAGRRVDRWIAVCAVLVAAARAHSARGADELARYRSARRDPAAAAELVAVMRAGERTEYIADYRFTRRTSGRREAPRRADRRALGQRDLHARGRRARRRGREALLPLPDRRQEGELLRSRCATHAPAVGRDRGRRARRRVRRHQAGGRQDRRRTRDVLPPALAVRASGTPQPRRRRASCASGPTASRCCRSSTARDSIDAQRATRVQRRVDDAVMTKFLSDFGPAQP